MQKYNNHSCLLQHITLFAETTNKIALYIYINLYPAFISYYHKNTTCGNNSDSSKWLYKKHNNII